MAESASVRWAQASTTVRARSEDRDAKEPWCSGVNTTTSHRPTAGDGTPHRDRSPTCRGSGSSASSGPSEGKRFSKTTTSKSSAGISDSRPPTLGHSGHWSAGGR